MKITKIKILNIEIKEQSISCLQLKKCNGKKIQNK